MTILLDEHTQSDVPENLSVEWLHITPELAQEMLNTSPGNRSIRKSWVQTIAREMTHGRWEPGASVLIVDDTGALIEGHHRLTACVAEQVSFSTLVVRGVKRKVRDVVDTGIARKARDILKFANYENSDGLAATIRVGILRERGLITDAGAARAGGGNVKLSNNEYLEYAEKNPDVIGIVEKYSKVARELHLPGGLFCHMMYEFSMSQGEDKAEKFAMDMANRSTNGLGDPRLYLMRWADAKIGAKHRIGLGEGIWMLVMTWNEWLAGKTRTQMANPFYPSDSKVGAYKKGDPKKIPAVD